MTKWAKIGPSWAKIGPNAIGVPIVIVETCPFGSRLKAQAQGLETPDLAQICPNFGPIWLI